MPSVCALAGGAEDASELYGMAAAALSGIAVRPSGQRRWRLEMAVRSSTVTSADDELAVSSTVRMLSHAICSSSQVVASPSFA